MHVQLGHRLTGRRRHVEAGFRLRLTTRLALKFFGGMRCGGIVLESHGPLDRLRILLRFQFKTCSRSTYTQMRRPTSMTCMYHVSATLRSDDT